MKGSTRMSSSSITTDTTAKPALSLVARVAERFNVEPNKMLDTLKATAFKSDKAISNEQMMSLLIVADQYHLNPFTKEIFAFSDDKRGGIVPVVSVDGWARIINEHPQMDGVGFEYDEDIAAMTCTLYRKDRTHAISVTEYLIECKRNTQPWNSHPRRMLRHKALIQCARLAFGFAGIYDEDEAARIVHAGPADVVIEPPSAGAARVRAVLTGAPVPGPAAAAPQPAPDDNGVIDMEPEPPPAAQPPPPPPAAPAAPSAFAKLSHDVLHAPDIDAAGLALDRARSVLSLQQQAELLTLYRNKWQPPQE
jgi:phage recombination protein Bet